MRQVESILWGIIAAAGALILEILISTLAPILLGPGKELVADFASPLSFLLIISVLAEEISKYLVIAGRIEKFSYGRSLVVNSLLAGLGFSLVELALIYGKFSASFNSFFGLKEISGLVLIHILTAGIIGYFIALRGGGKSAVFIKTIVLVFIIHFSYNALIIWQSRFSDLLIFSFLGAITAAIALSAMNINKKLAT